MYCLEVIVEMNNRPIVVEDNFSRHCSYSGDTKSGIVLHSAKHRNTMFLMPRSAKNFLRRYNSVNSAEARDRLIESYS